MKNNTFDFGKYLWEFVETNNVPPGNFSKYKFTIEQDIQDRAILSKLGMDNTGISKIVIKDSNQKYYIDGADYIEIKNKYYYINYLVSAKSKGKIVIICKNYKNKTITTKRFDEIIFDVIDKISSPNQTCLSKFDSVILCNSRSEPIKIVKETACNSRSKLVE